MILFKAVTSELRRLVLGTPFTFWVFLSEGKVRSTTFFTSSFLLHRKFSTTSFPFVATQVISETIFSSSTTSDVTIFTRSKSNLLNGLPHVVKMSRTLSRESCNRVVVDWLSSWYFNVSVDTLTTCRKPLLMAAGISKVRIQASVCLSSICSPIIPAVIFASLSTVPSSIWSEQVAVNLVCVLFTAKYPFMSLLCTSRKVCGTLRMSYRYCMRHLVYWRWSATTKYGNIREVAVKWDSQSQSRSAWLNCIAISSISKNYRQKANVGDAFRRVLKAFIMGSKVIKVSFAFWSAIRALALFAMKPKSWIAQWHYPAGPDRISFLFFLGFGVILFQGLPGKGASKTSYSMQ